MFAHRRFFYERLSSTPRRSRRTRSRRGAQVEPLEPRLLLSADLTPFAVDMARVGSDLTLRLDAATQSIQLLDSTHPDGPVVVEHSRDATSAIHIHGSDGPDRLVFDASLLPLAQRPATSRF